MALSQYVAINFLTKFDKKGLERATKELKGFDKVVATSTFRLKAFAKAGAIAAAAGLTILAKNSIQAALAQERLDKSVEQSLRSINELGELPSVNAFISDLEKISNITKDRLTPAINGLIIQTGNLTKAQNLFSVAVDTSAGAGIDLTTVSNALGKASRGNFKALGALGLGFDALTAKEIGLAEITDYLTLKFGGAAQRATETFGGQLDSLRISAGAAQTALGEGFLTAFEIIADGGNSADYFGAKLEQLGLNGGYVLIGLADKVNSITEAFEGLSKKFEGSAASNLFKFLFSTKQIPVVGGWLEGFGKIAEKGKKIAETTGKTLKQTKQEAALAKRLADLQVKLDKIASSTLNKQKNLTKEKKAQQAIDKKKTELEGMFDLEKINLQAALSRKLSGEDQIRVEILKKLAEGTAEAIDEAERYADILKVIEDGQITSEEVEMLAAKWGITGLEVIMYLKLLFDSNEELRKMLGLLDEIGKKAKGISFRFDPARFRMGEEKDRIGEPELPESDEQERLRRFRELGAPEFALGGIVTRPTAAIIGEAGAEAVIPLDQMGSMGSSISINVAGSIISEGELQSVIQNVLYNMNRAGSVSQLTNLGR
jgi:hypothetical protein